MIQVIYYREKCIGCGSCCDIAPQRWSMHEKDGKSNLKDSLIKRNNIYIVQTTEDEYTDLMNVSENCPVGIIEINQC